MTAPAPRRAPGPFTSGAGARALLHVDAFTDVPFTGNPAAVLLDAQGLSEEQLPRIATELNLPATVFVWSLPPGDGPRWRLRWFSGAGMELAFCGHGTLAATHALRESGWLTNPEVVFATGRGKVRVSTDVSPSGLTWLSPDPPAVLPVRDLPEAVLDALGMLAAHVAPWAPVARSGDGDLLVPVTELAVLRAVRPDQLRLRALSVELDLRGVALVARETIDPGATTHSRFFAPRLGIPEDPATGSLHTALGVWLWQANVLPHGDGVATFRAEQGDLIGRPGRLTVEVQGAGDVVTRVRVGGRAVTLLSGTLRFGPGP